MNVLKREKRDEVVRLLREGYGLRHIERETGVHRDTVMRLRDRLNMKAIFDGDTIVIACTPEQLPDPGKHSYKGACVECGVEIWLGSQSRAMVYGGAKPVCTACAAEAVEEEGGEMKLHPRTEYDMSKGIVRPAMAEFNKARAAIRGQHG